MVVGEATQVVPETHQYCLGFLHSDLIYQRQLLQLSGRTVVWKVSAKNNMYNHKGYKRVKK